MNKGDKVVCIKEHTRVVDFTTIRHVKGNIYVIINIDYSHNTVYINEFESESGNGLWFNLNLFHYANLSFFREYFITLAEWRDKQIDSILNE